MTMTLKTAAALGSIVILALFAALSVALARTADVLDRNGSDLALAGESIRLAEELKADLLTHNRNAFLYSLHRDPSRLEGRTVQRERILGLVAAVQDLTKNDLRGEQVLVQLERSVRTYLDQRERLSDSVLPATEQYNQISGYVDEAIEQVDELIRLDREQMRELVAEIENRNRLAEWLAVGLLTSCGILLILLTGAMFLFIARPLGRLAAAVASYGETQNWQRAELRGVREIRQIASNFNAMADRLEERRQDQLSFVASIAHDLRNPLNSISMVSELLVQKSADKDQELARIVLRQVHSLDQLVQDLLDVSRIEAGQLDLKFTWHELKPLIRDAVDFQRGGRDLHQWKVDLPDDAILCHCDRVRMGQVLNNLLSNAMKYSPNGGLIIVRVRQNAEEISIEVQDQGIGVPPDEQDRIFKPFQRSSQTRHTIPGIGLGLSASRRIVEAHGGHLTVASADGGGSLFRVVLPRKEAAESPAQAVHTVS